jgi:hypothetical protein
MQDKSIKPKLEWKVVGLGQSGGFNGPLPIDAMRFSKVKKLLTDKCYRRAGVEGPFTKYMHSSIRNLYVFINEGEKLVRAQADGASALAQAADDLELPSYRSE